MLKIIIVLVAIVVECIAAYAQITNPHDRDFERAHPSPVLVINADSTVPMVPVIEGIPYPSWFLNVNTIIQEDDPLPVQNESSIAINPRNPRNLIASAVDYRDNSSTWAYSSSDGGLTWNNVNLGKARTGWASSNDPSVCFDREGRGYLCYGGFIRAGNQMLGENGVFVSITNDGGKTWNPKHIAVMIHTGQQTADSAFEDKYYIHADTCQLSPYADRLYIPWKRVYNSDSSTQIVISHSADRGLTWSLPKQISDRLPNTSEDATFGQSFPLARTGPDGTVHIVWNSGTEQAVRYARSTDGGETWTPPRILHHYQPFGVKSNIGGQTNSRVKSVVRAEAYPSLVIDNTKGVRSGWIYSCWAADNYPNIYFSRSTDNGDTWSEPRIVHSDTTNDQFWSWIALDPSNGDLAVMYLDSRDDPNNILVNCYVSYSSDGGTTWIDRKVGDGENDLRRNPFANNSFAGDYNGCDFLDGHVYPSWVDTRNTTITNKSDDDVYTAIINVRAPEAPSKFIAQTIPDEKTAIALNWTSVNTRSFGQPLDTAKTHFSLFREKLQIGEFPMSVLSYKDSGLNQYHEYHYTLVAVTEGDTCSPRHAAAYAGGSKLPGIPTLVSAKGSNKDTFTVVVTIPTTRLDGVNKLVNLSKIRLKLNSFTYDFDVDKSDTGKTLSFLVLPPGDGWYKLSAATIDDDNNQSPYSDSNTVFTGNVDWRRETFDTLPNYLLLSGGWNLAKNFAFSSPFSYSESPSGNYLPSARDTVILYPFHLNYEIPEYDAIVVSWRVAAFVANGDTAFLEFEKGLADTNEWKTLAWWNASQDPRWTDTTKGDDAWRYGSIPIDAALPYKDTLLFRLRFRSNITVQSDGFYIDDLNIEYTSAVKEPNSMVKMVYPQPAESSVLIGMNKDVQIERCTVLTIDGSTISVPWIQQGQSVIINVSALTTGTYSLLLQCGSTVERERIVVIH